MTTASHPPSLICSRMDPMSRAAPPPIYMGKPDASNGAASAGSTASNAFELAFVKLHSTRHRKLGCRCGVGDRQKGVPEARPFQRTTNLRKLCVSQC